MPTPDSTVTYLRSKDLAELLHLTTRTLSRWRQEGKGPDFHREGRTIFYRSDDVDSWSRAKR
jgi:predicted site-specific integrase-resolvase